jgi:hypothetical protein
MVRGIKTYPPDRFNPTQSSISFYEYKEWWARNGTMQDLVRGIRVFDPQDTYEGVLIQLELQTGESQSFMIASKYGKFLEDEDRIGTRWRWHYWQVSPEDAFTILSGKLEETAPVVERVYRAIKNPEYAQTLNSQIHWSHVSISIAKDYLRIVNEAIVVCHMHFAQI